MENANKFQGKYRIPSARWAAWDYGGNAAYFDTICTAERTQDFGTIANGKIDLSLLGESAQDCWYAIPAHFPFVELGEFVVMPNHVHGIVVINKHVTVETQYFASLQRGAPKNKFGPQSQNLASVIRGYKIGVTQFARLNNIPFTWQARYHDHVIRSAEEHALIQRYILNNLLTWEKDPVFSQIPVMGNSLSDTEQR